MNQTGTLAGTRLWITGASDGIGRAVAIAALAAGARVAVSGRRTDALAALAPPNATNASDQLLPLAFDIRDAAAARDAAATIRERWGGLDWALANAGDCLYLDPRQWDDDALRHMMDVNYYGVANTAAAALPLLDDRRDGGGRGLFAVTASAAVLAPLPRGGAYGASKAAACYLVESLRGHYPTIDFSLIYPGFVKTPLTDKNDFPMPTLMPVDKAATLILHGLRRRRARILFPRRLIIALRLIDMLPARLQQQLLANMARNA